MISTTCLSFCICAASSGKRTWKGSSLTSCPRICSRSSHRRARAEDAPTVIDFPDCKLPIDAKFPREQVIALFENNDKAEIEAARTSLVRVMKAEAKCLQPYIQPENGTTEIALVDLPSETLYMEVIRNRGLGDWMHEQHVSVVD
jgi:DNA anti-recombination protein RmuC